MPRNIKITIREADACGGLKVIHKFVRWTPPKPSPTLESSTMPKPDLEPKPSAVAIKRPSKKDKPIRQPSQPVYEKYIPDRNLNTAFRPHALDAFKLNSLISGHSIPFRTFLKEPS